MGAKEEDWFQEGAEVEVNLDEPGFRGSWYSATVIKSKSKSKSKSKAKDRLLHLEFHNLMADDNPSKPLRELVNTALVRPIPPRESFRIFKLSEEVDAFHNDGWWEGVVTDVLPDPDPDRSSTYSVFFRTSREQLVFHHTDLRLHREWVHGQWVPPLQEEQQQQPPPAPAPAPQHRQPPPLVPDPDPDQSQAVPESEDPQPPNSEEPLQQPEAEVPPSPQSPAQQS